MQCLRFQPDNEISHVANDRVQIRDGLGQPRLRAARVLFHQISALLQGQADCIDGLNDSVVQIPPQLHALIQRAAQSVFALLQRLLRLFALGDVPRDALRAVRSAGQLLHAQIHPQHHPTPVFGPHFHFAMRVGRAGFELL